MSILCLTGNIAHRLVQQYRYLPCLGRPRLGGQGDHGIGSGPGTQLRDPLAIYEYQPTLDESVRLAPRAQPAFGQQFGNPDTLRIIHGR